LNENFEALGYESNFFILNMGNLGIVMFYKIGLLIFYAATKNCKSERFMKIRNLLTKDLIWNSIIGFVNESYFLMTISTITNLYFFKFNSLGTVVSSNLTMVSCFVLVGFPSFILYFMVAKKDKLLLRHYRETYGELF